MRDVEVIFILLVVFFFKAVCAPIEPKAEDMNMIGDS